MLPRALFVAALLLPVPSFASNELPDLGESARQVFSSQDEEAMGRAIVRDLASDPHVIDDPDIVAYLNHLGHRLAAVSTRNQREFSFFVVDDPSINAFALPGGHIGVHTGLLLAAQSESELAGVLAHEIAHVTQDHIARLFAAQSRTTLPSLAALALAILAARSNPSAATAAIASTQAFSIQNQLNFSRDFEREADRIGFDTLTRSGFDPHGMASFFGKLQRAGRFAEASAPAYLRTHPLTAERIADMEARDRDAPYRQVQDSLEFQLVRARLRARGDTPDMAVSRAQAALQEKRYASETAAHYELVVALIRAARYAEAETEYAALARSDATSPMLRSLGGELAMAENRPDLAVKRYRSGLAAYPDHRPLVLGEADAEIDAGQPQAALDDLEPRLALHPDDARMWRIAARAHAKLGQRLASHRAEAEAYAAEGNLVAAIEQVNIGLKNPDGDFREASIAEARRREWQAEDRTQRKEKENP